MVFERQSINWITASREFMAASQFIEFLSAVQFDENNNSKTAVRGLKLSSMNCPIG